jgi:hypothetical protein
MLTKTLHFAESQDAERADSCSGGLPWTESSHPHLFSAFEHRIQLG